MSVPSTLVKCLYLFFDLPHMEAPVAPSTQQQPPPPQPTAPQEKTAGQQELPLADRRVLLQKVFVQVKWQPLQFRLGGFRGIDKSVLSSVVEKKILGPFTSVCHNGNTCRFWGVWIPWQQFFLDKLQVKCRKMQLSVP